MQWDVAFPSVEHLLSSMRRLLEFLLATTLLVLTAPVLLVLGLLIRITSEGPALFRQERVGLAQQPFICLKLRTMKTGTRQAGTHEIGASAITTIGHYLRKSKLDELPQLINVLRGQMSFVGPRPCLPIQTELISEREARGVYALRPGITGLAQVRGIDMSNPLRLAECDAEYVERRTLMLDAKIILQTMTGHGLGDHTRQL